MWTCNVEIGKNNFNNLEYSNKVVTSAKSF